MFVYLKFLAFAETEDSENLENPMILTVNVIDQNDNRPIFEYEVYTGEVAEASPTSTVSAVS